jgi:hypothetical protein
MCVSKLVLHWPLYFALVVLLIGCGQQWSHGEKENAEHFVQSISFVVQAHELSNRRGSGSISKLDLDQILALYKSALRETNIVTDEVLAKTHSELPKNYRLYFQKGIELRINSWTNDRPYEEIQGSALMDSWADWYERNRENIR